MKKAFAMGVLLVAGLTIGCSETTAPVIDIQEPPLPVEPEVVHIVKWATGGSIRFTANAAGAGAVISSDMVAAVDTAVLYLIDSILPTGTLSPNKPTGWILPNFDSTRDSRSGLLLAKSVDGLVAEQDTTKYHQFLAAGPIELSGVTQFVFWSAIKDFDTTKGGVVEAGLFECDTNATNCRLISSATKPGDPWATGSSWWVERTLDFGTVADSVAANKVLVLKIIVGDSSDDDMWFAYDNRFLSSRLIFETNASVEKPDQLEWTFLAVRGEPRVMELSYVDESGAGQPLPFFSLDASQPTQRPDGSAIAVGDSIEITVAVDTTEMIVYLQPTGLQFDSTATPFRLWYGGAGGDLNGDGVVDDVDAAIENEMLGIWYQEDATKPWERLQTEQSVIEGWLGVALKHFSNYAVAW